MSLLGNLIWLIFGGFLMAACYFVYGVVFCITIIGIPVGVQLFKLGMLSLWPFGREVVNRGGEMGCGSMLLNLLWLVCGGLKMAVAHALIGLLFCITIVGIPFGMQHFKLAALVLTPFGKEIV